MPTSNSRHPGSWPHVVQCIAAFIGPIVLALLIVRFFLLSDIEQLEWQMLLQGQRGPGSFVRWGERLETATAAKLAVGAIVGGVIGWMAVQKIDARYREP